MGSHHIRLLAWLVAGATCLSVAWAEKGGAVRPEGENLALGRAVQFNTPPNDRSSTDPGDARQLTDGRLSPATPMWYDRKSSVGWALLDPTVFTIDLGAVHPIRGVALHMGAGRAGVEWPSSIRIYVSDDGARYSLVGDLMQLLARRPPEKGYAAFWLVADKLETHGRSVRFVCSPKNLGNGAYIMLDEVEILRGDPAWLDRPLVWAEAPERWLADWSEITWRDNAGGVRRKERPTSVVFVDGAVERGGDAPLQQAAVGEDGMTFTLNGEAGRPRRMSWTGELAKAVSTANCRWALLTFRAEGVRRTFRAHPLVTLEGVNDRTAGNAVTLLEANMALNDGLSHTLLRPLPEGFTLHQLKVVLLTESDSPRLILERLELLKTAPAIFNTEISAEGARAREGLIAVELGAALNGTLSGWFERALARHGRVLDGARALKPGWVRVSGAPFLIASGERDLALMPESRPRNERVEFHRQQVDSYNLGPESRHDTLSVGLDARAREALLLLALCAPPVQKRGGIPYTALRLDDIECLSVELFYDRGESEVAFPYSLADKACCIPARVLGAYAVAVDPTRRLRGVTLHNRQFGPNFALAGLTLNTSAEAVVRELAAIPGPERTARLPEPAARPAAVTRQGERLTFSNRWYEYSLDLTRGFALDRFVNRWNASAGVRLAPTSGLRVRVGDTIYTGRCFAAEVVRATQTAAELRLTSSRPELPLAITVVITAHDSPELSFVARAENLGSEPLAAELCLPAFAGLALGDLARTRLFFPQYRAVDTAESIALRAPYGPEFTVQFMDVYSRPAGVGLMVRTDNREQRMATFTLRKDADGVAGGVCFPAEFNRIAPGASRSYPRVSLFAHGGDWRAAFELYRDWVRSWYRPHKSQDKDFFLNAWDLRGYRTSEKVSWRETRTPAILTPDRKEFLLEETFAHDRRYLGHVPDVVHFFNWTHNSRKDRNEYGVHSTPLAYEQVGGLELFRRAIGEVQTKWGRPLSLYTVTDRFRASALPDQALSKALAATAIRRHLDNDASAALRATGKVDGIIFPGFGDKRWTDFFVNDIAKMQRDTGCRVVYMDVFPRFSHLRGRNGVTPRQDDMTVVRRVRDALPADVALWTEYSFTDVASQYADGSVHYYFLDLNQTFARRYNRSDRADDLFTEMPLNVGRYVLTRYRTFCLPVYIEAGAKPSQVDAVFVNGEPFHESTWRLHHSRLRVKINRAYVLKHEYSDCFNSENPTPRVDTAAAGLAANLFPGRNRKLWTLFNGRPKTWSGVVLTVPHRTGATYRDAWNGRELNPNIENGVASISLTLDPQQPGCVVQAWNR